METTSTTPNLNAVISIRPTGRTLPGECHLPRQIRHNAPELIAAQRVAELVREAFAAHGIATPTHAPNLAELANAIAQGLGIADSIPMPPKPKPLTEAQKAEHDEFID